MDHDIHLTINRIQHVGIPVTNMGDSESFYTRLGFKNVMEAPFDYNNGKGTAVMMQMGDIILELYQMPEAELSEIRSRKDGRIDHIAFDVPDINEAFSILKNAGLAVIEEAPVFLKFWKNGCAYFNVLGPGGERLEFNQIL